MTKWVIMGFPNYDFSEISSFGNPDSGISKVDIHFNLEIFDQHFRTITKYFIVLQLGCTEISLKPLDQNAHLIISYYDDDK